MSEDQSKPVRLPRLYKQRETSEGLLDVRLLWRQARRKDVWRTEYAGTVYDVRIYYTYLLGQFSFDVVLSLNPDQPFTDNQIRHKLVLERFRTDDDWIRAGLLWAEDRILSPMQRLAMDVISE